MLYLLRAKFLPSILVAALFLILAGQSITVFAGSDEGIRADLPLDGSLRVENPRGSVHLEVWNEKFVSVVAAVKGQRPKAAPVSIQRTEQLLTVSVSPKEVGMMTRVDLTLRIPERSRALVISETGEVSVQGLPAELTVESVYGDIRADFPASGDADIE